MDDDEEDEFWSVLPRYLESTDREALRAEYPALFERVERHVKSCALCQDLCRMLDDRGRNDKPE